MGRIDKQLTFLQVFLFLIQFLKLCLQTFYFPVGSISFCNHSKRSYTRQQVETSKKSHWRQQRWGGQFKRFHNLLCIFVLRAYRNNCVSIPKNQIPNKVFTNRWKVCTGKYLSLLQPSIYTFCVLYKKQTIIYKYITAQYLIEEILLGKEAVYKQ